MQAYRGTLGDLCAALSSVELRLTNALTPECTDGQLYDALYCDTQLSEEDLPAFLALLKPSGRIVVIVGEEMLLLQRSERDSHDFQREALQKVSGAWVKRGSQAPRQAPGAEKVGSMVVECAVLLQYMLLKALHPGALSNLLPTSAAG